VAFLGGGGRGGGRGGRRGGGRGGGAVFVMPTKEASVAWIVETLVSIVQKNQIFQKDKTAFYPSGEQMPPSSA